MNYNLSKTSIYCNRYGINNEQYFSIHNSFDPKLSKVMSVYTLINPLFLFECVLKQCVIFKCKYCNQNDKYICTFQVHNAKTFNYNKAILFSIKILCRCHHYNKWMFDCIIKSLKTVRKIDSRTKRWFTYYYATVCACTAYYHVWLG